jgi:hypothetical protein
MLGGAPNFSNFISLADYYLRHSLADYLRQPTITQRYISCAKRRNNLGLGSDETLH